MWKVNNRLLDHVLPFNCTKLMFLVPKIKNMSSIVLHYWIITWGLGSHSCPYYAILPGNQAWVPQISQARVAQNSLPVLRPLERWYPGHICSHSHTLTRSVSVWPHPAKRPNGGSDVHLGSESKKLKLQISAFKNITHNPVQNKINIRLGWNLKKKKIKSIFCT